MKRSTNLLVIVLDALREDSVVPSFEESGRCFKASTCIASAPWTLPSCTSLITGLDATRHGHYWPSHPLAAGDLVGALPSSFRKVGLVNNSILQSNCQLDAGFDRWTYLEEHGRPFEEAATLIGRARGRKPLFLLLHSNIAHDYYYPSAASYYDEAFPDDAGGAYALDSQVISWTGTTPAQRTAVRKTYRASAMKAVSSAREILELVRARDDFVTVIVSDHGEGLDYDRARLHHGGRLHDDLLRVPLYFDLPSTVPQPQRDDLVATLSTGPVAVTDVLPTLFGLGGVESVPAVDGRRLDQASTDRMVVSEERRYLYLKDRFRMNHQGRNRMMSAQDQAENERLQGLLAGAPLVRSYRSKTAKLIMTYLPLPSETRGPSDRQKEAKEWGDRLLGAPVVVLHGDHLFAFELYDLTDDPTEGQNLLGGDGVKMATLRQYGRAMSVSVPLGDDEVDLATMLDGADRIAAL